MFCVDDICQISAPYIGKKMNYILGVKNLIAFIFNQENKP